MATKRAVGASLAAAAIFSSILLSNFVLVFGAQQNLLLVSRAAEERTLYDQAVVVESIALLDLLDGAQEILSSGHFTCTNAISSVFMALAAERKKIGWGGVDVSATLAPGSDTTLEERASSLKPFGGSMIGHTNLVALAELRGSSPDGVVRINATEPHLLHLPLRLRALVAVCLDAVSQVSTGLSRLGLGLCNATTVREVMNSVSEVVRESAATQGFSSTLTYGLSSLPPCSVRFTMATSQNSVVGPEGPFSFQVEETVLLQTQA